MMLSIPAQIAGCKTIVLATPPDQDGNICKEVLYCAKKAGVTHILKAEGAQAISSMAWGYRISFEDSHFSIMTHLSCHAEHGLDSQVVLVIAGDGVVVNAIEEELSEQCNSLPRGEFAAKGLSHSFIAINFSNLYAPEHLSVNVKDAEKWESFIETAGLVTRTLVSWRPRRSNLRVLLCFPCTMMRKMTRWRMNKQCRLSLRMEGVLL
ncbi:hypothetical protein K1719_000827 [Acacia pycnantha]|nr:hypothetical protein K1719_000827 [Acacia pycnantha]